ncbi:hypothetical protein ACFLY0_02050 [Patescibacteria group bacterium]
MKFKLTSILMILSVLLVGMFGIFAFEMAMHGGNMDCPFAVLSSAMCSDITTAFAMTLHHISGFQALMQSILNSNVSLLLLSLVALAFLAVLFIHNNKEYLELNTELISVFNVDKKIKPNRFMYAVQKWLALIRNKDSFSHTLVYENISIK